MNRVPDMQMISDQILIQKVEKFDGPIKVGSLYVPESVNINRRESKIGRVLAVGSGRRLSNGMIRPMDLLPGMLVYYTRYGKETFEYDEENYVVCRQAGVFGTVILDQESGKPCDVLPFSDRLWVEEIPIGEKETLAGILIPEMSAEKQELRRWETLATGPGKFGPDNNRLPMEVVGGDTVYVPKMSGVNFTWYGEQGEVRHFRLVAETEIVFIETI